jgi:hypothetical protein
MSGNAYLMLVYFVYHKKKRNKRVVKKDIIPVSRLSDASTVVS